MISILQFGIGAILFALSTWWVFGKERWLLILPWITIIVGQLGRLPLPISNIGILLSDLLIPWVVFLWFSKQLILYKKLPTTTLGLPILLFLLMACVSMLFQLPFLPLGEVVQGGFYLVRLIAYMLFFFICVHVLKEQTPVEATDRFMRHLLWASVLLGITGVIQFIFVPDFRFMAVLGWDPHIGRLLGTWYDPNYIAGFFSVVIGLLVCHWYSKPLRERGITIPAVVLFLAGCFMLTYSRSGMVALGIVVFVLGVLRFRTLLLVSLLVFAVSLAASDRLQERFGGLVEGGLATITGSLDYDLDVTSQKRVESWDQSLSLLEGNLLLGIGYNTIEFRKRDRGLIIDENTHSASGSDSSLLNILITTGILGLLLYLLAYGQWMLTGIRLFLNKTIPVSIQGLGLASSTLFLALLLHSFFVNSLLLPFFLLLMMPLLALLDLCARTYLQPLGDEVYKEPQ